MHEVRHTWRMINMRARSDTQSKTSRRRQHARKAQGLGQAAQLTSSISIACKSPELALARLSLLAVLIALQMPPLIALDTPHYHITRGVTLQREPLIFPKLNHLFCGNCVATISTL